MTRPAPDPAALAQQAEAHHRAGRLAEAEDACRRLVALLPAHPMVHYNLARVLKDRGRPKPAEAALRRALALDPALVEGWLNLGTVLAEAGRWAEAAQAFGAGLERRPEFWPLLNALARVRRAQGATAEAEALLRRAVALAPQAAPALSNLAALRLEAGDAAEAAALFDRALAAAPTLVEALSGAGHAARRLGAMERAIDFYRRAAAARPDDLALAARLAEARLAVCDWSVIPDLRPRLVDPALAAGAGAIGPMLALTLPIDLDGAELGRFAAAKAAQAEAEARACPDRPRVARPGPRDRLTLGYLSADFHDHPTSHLMRGLFTAHDRDRVRVVALSLGPDDGSDYRRAIREGADAFVDLAALDLGAAARATAAAGIDILIDINVHTRGNRLALTALRPAPVTAAWLGLPGTSGARFIDWAIVDSRVAPPGCEAEFSESLLVLPHCYQPTDDAQPIGAAPPRAACGLPDGAVVLCCFNQGFKIEPTMFGVWMRILARVPDAVLWLLDGPAPMADTLRRAAAARGLDPARLIFAPRCPKAAHLARHAHADLALDTLYYSAHTTASDALWAGVPHMALAGTRFSNRVGASLLAAIGLPELICPDLAAYEERAVALAADPAARAALRARLAAHRTTRPLFDTARFAADLERGLGLAWACAQRGQRPRRLRVPAA